ncbi:MAG: flavin reductase family protein [bacterium]|nr:flavin reductase family protein [bacterium]
MTISTDDYRDVLRHFPSGVTIVTVRSGETRHGLTVSAFASVSPDPPLVLIMIDHRHRAYGLLQEEGASFAVNILAHDQVELSNRFAWVKDEDRFAVGDWTTAATGAPVLSSALAWMDCSIYSRSKTGSHTIYVGKVEASMVERPDEMPLAYWNRGYRKLQEIPDSD